MVPTLNRCLWTSRGPKSALLDELPVKMWDETRALLRATSETTPGWCDSWHGLSLYTNNSVRTDCSTALSSPHEHFSKLLKPLFCRKTEKRWTRSGAKSSMTSQSTTALALPTPTYSTVAHYIMLNENQPWQQCTPENWSCSFEKVWLHIIFHLCQVLFCNQRWRFAMFCAQRINPHKFSTVKSKEAKRLCS